MALVVRRRMLASSPFTQFKKQLWRSHSATEFLCSFSLLLTRMLTWYFISSKSSRTRQQRWTPGLFWFYNAMIILLTMEWKDTCVTTAQLWHTFCCTVVQESQGYARWLCQCNFRIDTKQADGCSKSTMTSKKVVELFYDVVSPYSWLGFEVFWSSIFVLKLLQQWFCCDLHPKLLTSPVVFVVSR